MSRRSTTLKSRRPAVKSKSKPGSRTLPTARMKQRRPRLKALAREQGVTPVKDPESLAGDFWPEHENLDDFLAALQNWRREGREGK